MSVGRNPNCKMNRAITLLELLVSLVLLSLVILYFSGIESISRQDLFNTDHKIKVQNEVSYVLDHLAANITGRSRLNTGTGQMQAYGGAIGNTQISSQSPIDTTSGISGCNNAIKIWIDYNNNGQIDSGDKQIAYCYSPAPNYQIWYYSNYTDNPTSSGYEVLTGNRIRPDFSSNTSQNTYVVYSTANNYLDVQITGCWDPTQADGSRNACGTANNPSVTMHAYIKMPSVSTN